MTIKETIGNLAAFEVGQRRTDGLALEWWECSKRILHKKTCSNQNVSIRLLNQTKPLAEGDVLYADEDKVIVVEVLACDVMVLQPASVYETALACYEIGNKHLPLFFENGALLMPFDAPTHRMLQATGFTLTVEKRKLLHPLRTTVTPHVHGGSESLFSKILKRTAANE